MDLSNVFHFFFNQCQVKVKVIFDQGTDLLSRNSCWFGCILYSVWV